MTICSVPDHSTMSWILTANIVVPIRYMQCLKSIRISLEYVPQFRPDYLTDDLVSLKPSSHPFTVTNITLYIIKEVESAVAP